MGLRKKRFKNDPLVDDFAVASAKNMLLGNIVNMGLRLAIMILLPIFIGVKLDERFDSKPSLTLGAFFIAIFGASLLIYRTYSEMAAATEAAPKVRRLRRPRLKRLKRSKDV